MREDSTPEAAAIPTPKLLTAEGISPQRHRAHKAKRTQGNWVSDVGDRLEGLSESQNHFHGFAGEIVFAP
jgi:hypothetical protein